MGTGSEKERPRMCVHYSATVAPIADCCCQTAALPCPGLREQEMKAESEEEREAYDGLQAQLLAAHPAHLPLLLERLQRTQKAAAAGKGKAGDAAGWQVGMRVGGGGGVAPIQGLQQERLRE